MLCPNCKSIHLKNCFSLNYIKLYEVGYRCETHYCKYIGYCFYCQKNICKICKETHQHIIKEIKDISSDIENYIKRYNKYEKAGLLKLLVNKDITKYLCAIYILMNKNRLFNGHIYSILCELLKIDLKEYKDNANILFKTFNGKEFENYYSELLNKKKEGNLYYLNCFSSIKSFYKTKDKSEFKYDQLNITRREIFVQKLIDSCKSMWNNFINIQIMIDYENRINKLKISNKNLKIRLTNANSRILLLENTNKVEQENIHNILSRFLSDELLQTIIVNYYKFLEPISLNLNIFLDIISKGNYEILSNDKIQKAISVISTELSDKLNHLKNSPNNEELRNDIIELLISSSKIHFINDITINGEIIKKDELNLILDILFFIKDFGNITTHPNININESMKMLNIQSLPINFEIEQFYENNLKDNVEKKISKKIEDNFIGKIVPKLLEVEDDNYYHLNEFNLEISNNYDFLKNIEDNIKRLNNNIINKIEEIRNNLLQNFNIGKIKKKVKITDIIDTIFDDKDNSIYEESKDLIKVLLLDTDDIIKKYLTMNLEDELFKQNKSINLLLEAIEEVPSILQDFIKLNIPRHNTLKEYIFDNNNKNNNKYIKNFENKLRNENNMEIDCEKNEIILEACILLLMKTYEKEIEYLKSIQKKYETDAIKNIVYEEIDKKLNDIYILFEKRFNANTNFELSKAICDKFKINDTKNIKNILKKIIDKDIALDDSKNSKLNIISKLFYYQNE